jgi:hypothetical protein
MNKEKDNGKKVVTSSLPIATSEAPLVIDLPDGQKIVLGKIASGAVIEVATWRGTGRPDSRTNRIMLGMSDSASLENSAHKEENISQNKKGFGRIRFPKRKVDEHGDIRLSKKNTFVPTDKLLSAVSNFFSRFKAARPVEETHELDIDAWISRLSSDLKSKNVLNPEGDQNPRKPKSSTKRSAVKNKNSSTKTKRTKK